MLRFAVRRLLLLVPILLCLSILLFIWVRALPGSPAEALLGTHATPKAIAAIDRQLGLDEPLPVQYWRWLETVATGDLGYSIVSEQPVTTELAQRLPATIELTISAGLFACVFGPLLGFVAARWHRRFPDHFSLFLSLIGVSVPVFLSALLLKWLFAIKLGLLPTIGRQTITLDTPHPTGFYVLDGIVTGHWYAAWDAIRHLILPGIALGSIPLAIICRITRAAVLDVQNEEYVTTARAKGLSGMLVARRHVMRNAMLPVSTVMGLQVGLLLSGAILTETVFAIPGIGTWLYAAIQNRDYPVLEGGILFVAIVVVVVNLVVDLSYAVLDPRVRLA